MTAAREAVAAAERTRVAECKRRPQCRAREVDEATARAALAKAISDKAATDRAARLDTDAATVRTRLAKAAPVAAAADPGAAALAAYLATLFGVNLPAGLLAQWLVLVGVVALELGSALAVVLVRAASPSPVRRTRTVDSEAAPKVDSGAPATARPSVSKSGPKHTPLDTPRARGRTAKARLGPHGKARKLGQSNSDVSKVAAQARIVDTLKDAGGKLDGASVRGLGKLLGTPKSTVHTALAGLVAAGIVAKAGTALVLT